MIVEVLAAQVGQCMGLPCPNPYVVTVNPKHIGRPGGPRLVAFGSELKGRAISRSILDTDLLIEMLRRQKLVDLLCCFDEFIANGVRSPRDIVFDPESGLSIIDHEGALENGLGVDAAATNWIAARVVARLSEQERIAILKKLRFRAAAAHRIEFGGPPVGVQFHQEGIPIYRELVEFLKARLPHLDSLLSARVLPGQGHITEAGRQNESGGTSNL